MPDLPQGFKDLLPMTASVNEDHLQIGGCDTVALADEFGTPLFVFCEETFRMRAKQFRQAFPSSEVYYAAKAFFCLSLCRVLEQEGLGLDVASGGELHAALAGGFPPDRIIFHGNNKQDEDIARSVEAGVGRIAIDNLEEVERVSKVAASAGRRQGVVIRVTPGVEAHTHEYIQTGQIDSKFGLALQNGSARKAVELALAQESLEVAGLHAHIGSNILSFEPFIKTVEILFELAADLRNDFGFELGELNLGGGFGIPHLPGDSPIQLARQSSLIAEAVGREAGRHGLQSPRLCFEPGRYIVGNAMVTLYRVGVIKRLEGLRTYVSVDGGMSDNIRPALYGARYTAALGNKMGEMDGRPSEDVYLAGMHCESGDILVKDLPLPASVATGDLVVVPATGAYNYSMASNYNKQPRPGVVAASEGRVRVLVRRETFEDVVRLEQPLD